MRPADRQKVCSQCDGRIPWNAKECIYCGAEQAGTPPPFKQQTLQESLASFYAPPYAAKTEPPIFEREDEPAYQGDAARIDTSALHQEEAEDSIKKKFTPLFLLVVGTNLFTIGLLQLFFSTDGVLALEWDSTYWFFYCFSAIPMVYFGYKKAVPPKS